MWDFLLNLPRFFLVAGLSLTDLLALATSVGIFVCALLFAIKYASTFILVILERRFKNGHFSLWLNLVERVKAPLIIGNGVFFGALLIPIAEPILMVLCGIYVLVMAIFITLGVQLAIVNAVKAYFRAKGTSEEAIKTVANLARVTSAIILWTVVVLVLLQFSRVDTQALLGGLGIASVIVAFSFQNILKDIFAFFSIYVDRSFAVGDYVTFDSYSGTIKTIRMRTTKIQALTGHELIVSNSQLVNSVIQNYRSLKKRRVTIHFRVCPSTNPKKCLKLTQLLKDMFADPKISQRVEVRSVTINEITENGIEFYLIYRFLYHPGDSNFYQHLAYRDQILSRILLMLDEQKIKIVRAPYSGCA